MAKKASWVTRVTTNPTTQQKTTWFQCPEQVGVKQVVMEGTTDGVGSWKLFTTDIPTKKGMIEKSVITKYTPKEGDKVWVEAKQDGDDTKWRQFLKTEKIAVEDLF